MPGWSPHARKRQNTAIEVVRTARFDGRRAGGARYQRPNGLGTEIRDDRGIAPSGSRSGHDPDVGEAQQPDEPQPARPTRPRFDEVADRLDEIDERLAKLDVGDSGEAKRARRQP